MNRRLLTIYLLKFDPLYKMVTLSGKARDPKYPLLKMPERVD